MITIKQLEAFFWAVRLGSFTAAAERLRSTQSAISFRIQELERQFGVAVFDRTQRGVCPTVKGQELLTYVEQVLQLTRDIEERISDKTGIGGLVRLGVGEVVAYTWLPPFLKILHEQYPKITTKLDIALTMDLSSKLRNGELDVIFSAGYVPGTNFIGRSLGTIDFEWMASPSLGLPPGPLSPRDLQEWPIIGLQEESYHYARIDDWFKSNKAVPVRVDTSNSLSVVATLVAEGLGIGLLPPRCYQNEINAGRLRILATRPRLPPIEMFAIKSINEFRPVTDLITDLALSVSDYSRFHIDDAVPNEPLRHQ